MNPNPTVLHITTTDVSLELLIGPQLRAFSAAGYNVVMASAPGPFTAGLEASGIEHFALSNLTRSQNPIRDLRAVRDMYTLFTTLRPDVVHTHNPKPGIFGRIAARAARVPVVVNTVHGLYATPEDHVAKKAVVYGLERLAAACSDAELIQNPEDVDVLRSLRVPTSRLQLLGNGIDLERFRPSSDAATAARIRSELGVGANEIVVGAVGRLVWEKGYREVFEAAAILRNSAPRARLVVVGPREPAKADAVDDEAMAAARDLGVIFAGHRNDMEKMYEAIDVYVLASYREGFPRSAMEAAAMGIPVVTTDVRGCRQVVDHEQTGLIVPVRDGRALASAIERLVYNAEERNVFGEAGRAKAKAEFDQQQVIDITLATYQRLLAGAGIASPTGADPRS